MGLIMIKLRNTTQRIKIKEHLRSVKNHPTAEMIYNEVKKDLPSITLATTYRNLNKMADENEIYRLEIQNKSRFDGNVELHQHCVCKECGKIYDLFKKDISEYALKEFDLEEFTPDQVNIIYYGYCKKCKEE